MSDAKADARWRERIQTHGDPVKQIGVTAKREPIFLDMRELVCSPSEEAERLHLTRDSRHSEMVRKMALAVLHNAKLFIEATLAAIMDKSTLRSSDAAMADWCEKEGFCAVQDGLVTVIKRQGKVVRTMMAKVAPLLRDSVARAVNELTKRIPA